MLKSIPVLKQDELRNKSSGECMHVHMEGGFDHLVRQVFLCTLLSKMALWSRSRGGAKHIKGNTL